MQSDFSGTDLIRKLVETLPHLPGVYRMYDAEGTVLYVGKARDLKNRVSSYATLAGKNNRQAAMITRTAAMEFITTRNESEALLLEANLIKKLEPRYNILLRDGKSFPFLMMTKHDFPQIRKYRGQKREDGAYFGPFASAGDLNEVIVQLQRVFLLRPCTDSYFNARSRPCLQYQIKRCSAPCVNYIGKQEYAALVQQAKKFLRGENRQVQEALLAEMQDASAKQQFERAAILRDRLKALTQIQQEQGLQSPHVGEADLLALTQEKGIACVQVFFFRDGQNYGSQPHFLRNPEEQSEGAVLAAFIPQFYGDRPPPKQLLLSHEPEDPALLQEALSELAGHKVTLSVPQRGDKKELMQQGLRNAKQALRRHLDARMDQEALLEKVAALFHLPAPPQRIEVYDNSHISGTNAIGAMIVAGPEGFIKNQYRKFTIKIAEGDDDYAMMREVLRRRLQRLVSEEGTGNKKGGQQADPAMSPRSGSPCEIQEDFAGQLIIIDGGKGQLSAVRGVMEELGLWGVIPVVAIAKGPDRNAGRERFFVPVYDHLSHGERSKDAQRFSGECTDSPSRLREGVRGRVSEKNTAAESITPPPTPLRSAGAEPAPLPSPASGRGINSLKELQLPIDDPVLHYLQRLRDEAHRFAIGTHRAKRSAQIKKSELDSIPGIAAKRKKALLHHFGSSKAVANASAEELAQVEGISAKVAQKIWGWFHG